MTEQKPMKHEWSIRSVGDKSLCAARSKENWTTIFFSDNEHHPASSITYVLLRFWRRLQLSIALRTYLLTYLLISATGTVIVICAVTVNVTVFMKALERAETIDRLINSACRG